MQIQNTSRRSLASSVVTLGRTSLGGGVLIAAALMMTAPVVSAQPVMAEETSSDAPVIRGSDGMSDEAFGQRVRNYLLQNPEILREMADALQRKERARQVARDDDRIEARSDALFADPRDPVALSPDASNEAEADSVVTIVEFFDYRCGYCRQIQGPLAEALEASNNMRLVYKEFPVLGETSVELARLSLALKDLAPGSYARFHDALLGSGSPATPERALRIADTLGIERDVLTDRAGENDIARHISDNRALARTLGIRGTPAIVTRGTIQRGALSAEDLRAFLETAGVVFDD